MPQPASRHEVRPWRLHRVASCTARYHTSTYNLFCCTVLYCTVYGPVLSPFKQRQGVRSSTRSVFARFRLAHHFGLGVQIDAAAPSTNRPQASTSRSAAAAQSDYFSADLTDSRPRRVRNLVSLCISQIGEFRIVGWVGMFCRWVECVFCDTSLDTIEQTPP